VLESCPVWNGTNKFERLVDQWANGGAARFVYEALNHSFRRFEDRRCLIINRPRRTEASVRQMAHSRSSLEKCMVAFLLHGEILPGRFQSSQCPRWSLEEPLEVTSKALQSWVAQWLRDYDSSAARHETALHLIIDTLERYIGETQISRPKGTRKPKLACRPQLPTIRHLPARRVAIQRAWEKGLLTQEEYASIEPPRQQSNKSSGLDEYFIFEEPLEEPDENRTPEDEDAEGRIFQKFTQEFQEHPESYLQ
jgi:hypothetical protein